MYHLWHRKVHFWYGTAVDVLCDVTPHLAAYQTAVETRRDCSGMRPHAGQHSRLPCMQTLFFASLVYVAYRNRTETDELALYKGNFASSFRGFFFPDLPNILGNNFSIRTSILSRLISESNLWWEIPFKVALLF